MAGTKTRGMTGGAATPKATVKGVSGPVAVAQKRRRNFLEQVTATGEQTTLPPDDLVPIHIDVTVDNHRVQDTFSWNVEERSITPQSFATMLAADLGLPQAMVPEIVDQISEQIAAHVASAPVPSPTPAPVVASPPQGGGPLTASNPRRMRESRHIVRLNVRIGRVVLHDQFEWDLQDTLNNPDTFAESLCADVGLGTDHVGTVAHALRSQLAELAQFQERRQTCALVSEQNAVRKNADGWYPVVECLSLEQKEKLERKEKREARLQRRNRGKSDLSVYNRPIARTGKSRAGRRRNSRASS